MSGSSRLLRYVWRKLHKKGAKFDSKTAESIISDTIGHDVEQTYGGNLKNATVIEEAHVIDGNVYMDPTHATFKIRNDKEKRITTAHYYYPDPLGDRHLWYSKDSLNGGLSPMTYWQWVGKVEDESEGGEASNTGKSEGKGKEKEKAKKPDKGKAKESGGDKAKGKQKK